MKTTPALLVLVLATSCADRTPAYHEAVSAAAAADKDRCPNAYVEQRNKVVMDTNSAFLDIDVARTFEKHELPKDPKVDPSVDRAKLVAAHDELRDFLKVNRDFVCKGVELVCNNGNPTDPACYMNPSQSTYVDVTVRNDSLEAAYEALDAYLAGH